jgi:hypothetical protein
VEGDSPSEVLHPPPLEVTELFQPILEYGSVCSFLSLILLSSGLKLLLEEES